MENVTPFRSAEINKTEKTIILPAEIINIVNQIDFEPFRKDLLKYAEYCFMQIDETVSSPAQRERDDLFDKLHTYHRPDIEEVMTKIELFALDHKDETTEEIEIAESA